VATVAALDAIAADRGAARNAVLRDALEEYARTHGNAGADE
jgi:hypothetical protein